MGVKDLSFFQQSLVRPYIDKAESVLLLNDSQSLCGAEEGRTYDLGICSGLLSRVSEEKAAEILRVIRDHCRTAIFQIHTSLFPRRSWASYIQVHLPAGVVVTLDESLGSWAFRIIQYPQHLAYVDDLHFLWEHPNIHKSHTLSFHMQLAYDLGRKGWTPTYQKEKDFLKVFSEIRENGMDVPLYAQYSTDRRWYVARGNRALACAKALVRTGEWAPRAQVPIRAILATDPLGSDTPAVRLYHG